MYQPRSTKPSVFTCMQQVHNYLITDKNYKLSTVKPNIHLSTGSEHNGFVFIIFQTEGRKTGKIKSSVQKNMKVNYLLFYPRYKLSVIQYMYNIYKYKYM